MKTLKTLLKDKMNNFYQYNENDIALNQIFNSIERDFGIFIYLSQYIIHFSRRINEVRLHKEDRFGILEPVNRYEVALGLKSFKFYTHYSEIEKNFQSFLKDEFNFKLEDKYLYDIFKIIKENELLENFESEKNF